MLSSMQTPQPLRVAVFASGRGSNLQALIDARAAGRLPIALVGVFSDKPASGALERARAAHIEAVALTPKDFASREAYDTALFSQVDAVQPDLIVCAGYMRLISDVAVRRYEGRMINIHPSLLPKFPGLGTHAQALASGDRRHGASVHYVTPALDAGESLAARVLGREHPLLIASVRLIASGRVRQHGDAVEFDGRPLAAPLQLAADEETLQ
jgi:phosphoribosylglycinamide formyltransferase 1